MRPPSQKITPPLRRQRAQCPIIDTTCRTYARFSCPVSPFRHHRTHPMRIPPNSRTGVPVQRAVSMVAVRHRP